MMHLSHRGSIHGADKDKLGRSREPDRYATQFGRAERERGEEGKARKRDK